MREFFREEDLFWRGLLRQKGRGNSLSRLVTVSCSRERDSISASQARILSHEAECDVTRVMGREASWRECLEFIGA